MARKPYKNTLMVRDNVRADFEDLCEELGFRQDLMECRPGKRATKDEAVMRIKIVRELQKLGYKKSHIAYAFKCDHTTVFHWLRSSS